MAARIRLTRIGRKNRPQYRIAVFDSRTRRDGPSIEVLGMYDPLQKERDAKVRVDRERLRYWLRVGARPAEGVGRLLKHVGAL